MKTLRESILDDNFDIDELQEISIELGPIYEYTWESFGDVARIISPKAPQIFDEIVKTIQNIIKLHKSSKLPKVDVFYDESHKTLYIIEKKAGAAMGVMFSSFESWDYKKQIDVNFSWALNYKSVYNTYDLKKIGTVPLAVILDIKEKMHFEN